MQGSLALQIKLKWEEKRCVNGLEGEVENSSEVLRKGLERHAGRSKGSFHEDRVFTTRTNAHIPGYPQIEKP